MKKFLLIFLSVVLLTPAFGQSDDAKVQKLSDTFSKYLVNNLIVHLKGIRFLETTGKLQRGMTLQYTVVLNKKGTVEDVQVVNGVNEVFDDDFRTPLFLMPKSVFSDITITGEKSYIPIILDVKLSACEKSLAESLEEEYGKKSIKRWKRFRFEKHPELLEKFPAFNNYLSVKDQYYSSVWYIYFRLMHLKISLPEHMQEKVE